jgi:hypothetical protein
MKTSGWFGPLVLAGVLAVGFAVVWGLVGMWAAEVGAYLAGAEGPRAGHLSFLADGTPLVAYAVGRYGEREYRDLEGNPAEPPDNDRAGWLAAVSLPASLPARPAGTDVPWEGRLRSFADGRSPAVFWYFVTDGRPDGTGWFVGYDSGSKARVGYLGLAGLREDVPPAAERIPFAGETWGPKARVWCTQRDRGPTEHPRDRPPGRAPRGSVSTWDVYVLGRDGRVYHADLQQRRVHVALDVPGVRSAALAAGPHDPLRGTPHRLAVRTDDVVRVLDEEGRELHRYPIPEILRGAGLTFGETTAGEALFCGGSPQDDLATEVDYRIFWVAPGGGARAAAVTLPWPGWMRPMQTLAGVVMPSPLVLAGFVAKSRTSSLLDGGLAATYPEALARALAEFRPALVLAQVLAAGLALLCYRRQVRYGARGAGWVVWPLFVLVLGLPGWVGYRFGRTWPVLEACPACGAGVPRDRGDCSRCAAEFPRPALRGTEVFA